MSIQTKLFVDDKVFDILESNLHYYQDCDYNYRPQQNLLGGLFNLVIKGTKEALFTEWATQPQLMKNAKIVQTSIAMNGKSRTFELIDTHCILDKNHFNSTGKEPLKNYITLSPAILKLNDSVLHQKHWKVTNLQSKKVTPTSIDKEPKLTNYIITDLNNEELEEYNAGDTIRLHIETKDAIGKKITISLNDKTHDFKYNGALLINDTLLDYQITKEKELVELEVVEQQD